IPVANPLSVLAISGSGGLIAGGETGQVDFWSIPATRGAPSASGQPMSTDGAQVGALTFGHLSDALAVGLSNDTVLLSTPNHPTPTPLAGHAYSVTALAFGQQDKLLASGDLHGTIIVWDVTTGNQLHKLVGGPTNRLTKLAFAADGTMLASGSQQGDVALWDL